MILFESFCLEPLSFKPCSRDLHAVLARPFFFKMAADREERIYCVQCVCEKIIQVKMLLGEFSSKEEEALKNRVKQHAYSLRDDGKHKELGWKDVVQMPVLSYNLKWEDKQEVRLSLTRCPIARTTTIPAARGRRAIEDSSDDDSSRSPKRARLTLSEEPHTSASSSARPFAELDSDEKLKLLKVTLDRIETKLDQVLESVALLS